MKPSYGLLWHSKDFFFHRKFIEFAFSKGFGTNCQLKPQGLLLLSDEGSA